MKYFRLFQWKAVVMYGVLLFSLMITTPALADETHPPTETGELVTQPSGEELAVEEESVEVTETSSSVEGEMKTPSSEESVSEILEQLPADTELIILDENGEALPLATEAVEEAIILRDPIWCPVGVAPKPGNGGCSNSFGSLSDLVAGFTPPAKNGVIWIEVGNDLGVEVEIDGLVWTAAANYSLTLQGGWVGPAGPPVGSGAIVGTTTFDTAISIINWNGVVTINDISFYGATNTMNPGMGSLYVETTKNIVVSNVISILSGGGNNGAHLDNSSSTTQATVTVKNSVFNSNALNGLTIVSNGAVTLNNVTANKNSFFGVSIGNNNDSVASVVSVAKGSFNQNFSIGLIIVSNGAITLSQIVASDNTSGGSGVIVDNTSAPTPQAITVKGFLTANSNEVFGLLIQSNGAVTLENITTDYNKSGGSIIDNSMAPKPYAVTINGVNSMSNNIDNSANGLDILTLSVVTLNNITANHNGNYGVVIDNDSSAVPNAVNIKGTNLFNDNGFTGLLILSRGAITLYNVTANSNGEGVHLSNWIDALKPQNINLFGTNTFNNNNEQGLVIFTYGAVTLNNISANYNGLKTIDQNGSGVNIFNVFGSLVRPVSIKGTNNFNSNDGYGLLIASFGAVSISNITANDNGIHGASINNQFSLQQSPVTISGYGTFNSNSAVGLFVLTNGAITTNNLNAQFNDSSGVYLDTFGLKKGQSVNVKGNNTFIGNGQDISLDGFGLIVHADGNITVSNITASQNKDDAATGLVLLSPLKLLVLLLLLVLVTSTITPQGLVCTYIHKAMSL